MKNPFFSEVSLAERLYPLALRLPEVWRLRLARGISRYQRRRLEHRGLPERLTIFLTGRCNLRCSHCFIATGKRRKAWEMGLNEYRTFFTKARGLFSQVLLTGGEPTLRDDLGDILVLASRAADLPTATIFTNGILRDRLLKAVNQALADTPLKMNFQLSLDGPPAFHDSSRGVPGALAKTLATVKDLQGLRKAWPGRVGRLTLCTALSRQNLEHLPAIIQAARGLGTLHSFTFVRSSQTGVFNLKRQSLASNFAPEGFGDYLSVAEMEQALALLHQHLWRYEAKSLFYRNNRIILENIVKSLKAQKPQAPCFSGKADLVLLPNGEVARCEMLKSFANLKDYHWDLKSLLGSEAFQKHLQETRGCWCTHDCAIGLSIMYNENLLIDLFKHT